MDPRGNHSSAEWRDRESVLCRAALGSSTETATRNSGENSLMPYSGGYSLGISPLRAKDFLSGRVCVALRSR